MDRDPLFTACFRQMLEDSGTNPVRLPPRSPNLNAFAERFVLWIKSLRSTTTESETIKDWIATSSGQTAALIKAPAPSGSSLAWAASSTTTIAKRPDFLCFNTWFLAAPTPQKTAKHPPRRHPRVFADPTPAAATLCHNGKTARGPTWRFHETEMKKRICQSGGP
jgi:hypothetical protein